MPTTSKRKFRELLRYTLLGLVVLMIAALSIAAWWVPRHGEEWLEGHLRGRINATIDKASIEGYRFKMQGLETDVRTGRLSITGVELDFAPALIDSLRKGAIHYLFSARAERIELRGLSYWRLLLANEFVVTAFELKGPTINYVLRGDTLDLGDPFTRLDDGDGLSIALLSADTVLVRKATATVEDLGERLPVLQISGLELEGHAINVFMGARHSGVRVVVGAADLLMDSLRTQLADGSALSVGAVRLSLDDRSGHIEDLRLVAQRSGSTMADTVRRPRVDLVVDSILLSAVDVDRLISHQVLDIGNMAIHGMRVNAELDKTMVPGPTTPKALPPEALLGIGFPIRIDTLTIERARVTYRERDGETERWGEVSFNDLHGRFHHISNQSEAIAAHPTIIAEISGLLFGSAPVTAKYNAALDGSQEFEFSAIATDLQLVKLNALTRPLLRLEVNGGRLERLQLTMEGDHRKAKGKMMVHFTDLLVRVERGTPRALHNRMFGNVMETMLKETYGGGLSADRERKFNIDRDPNRALTTYLWHATREGVARNLAPEAWDRMRHVLRTDAVQRKEHRNARRARKQEQK